MPDQRRERAIAILRELLELRGDNSVTTTSLLYKCQEVARLLELPEDECKWIGLELVGYPFFGLEYPEKKDIPPIPPYRCPELDAVLEITGEGVRPYTVQTHSMRTTKVFFVTQPIGMLETCSKPIPLSYSTVVDAPKRSWGQGKKIPTTVYTHLSVERARGIAWAVRAVVSEFAVAEHTALAFEQSVETIVGSVRHELADFLSRLNRPLLDLLEETVKKQESSSDPIEWRDVIENLRSILRRFTSIVLRDNMIPNGETRPEDPETSNKTRMITNWVRAQMSGGYHREAVRLETNAESLEKQQKALIDIINKQAHGEMGKVAKGEVDRTVLATVLWMTDLAAALESAGFK